MTHGGQSKTTPIIPPQSAQRNTEIFFSGRGDPDGFFRAAGIEDIFEVCLRRVNNFFNVVGVGPSYLFDDSCPQRRCSLQLLNSCAVLPATSWRL